jgi:transmembrane sensor
MTQEKLQILLEKYLNSTASAEEEQELTGWYHAANNQEVHWPVENEEAVEALKNRMLQQLQQAIHPVTPAKERSLYHKIHWQVAAAILLLLGVGTWLWLNKPATILPRTATAENKNTAPILPGGNKATLTLADGRTIELDTASNTILAQEGNTRVVKLNNGQLAYKDASQRDAEAPVLYNTIRTPNGGQYEIILPDGSHAWLNAASILRFPTVFTGVERKVQLTGEAYFEVAKNTKMPFRVYATDEQQHDHGTVEVLGTHFNVNAYGDEPVVKTTLLEGKVKVSVAAPGDTLGSIRPVTLSPGMQSSYSNDPSRLSAIQIRQVDTDEVTAWKNGLFNFNNADIKTVMRQLARWYNVEVVYDGPLSTEKFEGEIPRNSTLAEVFKILELSAVHFKVEGRKVIVMP